jgi:hypothetical protein
MFTLWGQRKVMRTATTSGVDAPTSLLVVGTIPVIGRAGTAEPPANGPCTEHGNG